jgi:excisionase family DNA binding protein
MDYMTTEQVAEYLQVPVNTIYKWRVLGSGPRAARVGRHLRWRRADVDQWFEEQTA